MKVLVIGANGQLGTDLAKVFRAAGDSVFPFTHAQLDVCSEEQIANAVAETKPDVVVNTAAFHRVDECETKAALAFQVNGMGALNLARACNKAGRILAHYTSDYAFGGYPHSTPFVETDLPAPLSVYGASKVLGENLIPAYTDRYFVIRTCGLYGVAGSSGKGGNFVETMLKKANAGDAIRVVDDQILTPTYTADLAEATRKLILTGKFGLYHVTSEGQCSWYEFTRYIFDCTSVQANLSPVKTSDFYSPVKRPAYSVLSKTKLRSVGVTMPSWKEAIPRYLAERAKRNSLTTAAPVPAAR
jgi:dTDP-4-dehydrorhamnose reductase